MSSLRRPHLCSRGHDLDKPAATDDLGRCVVCMADADAETRAVKGFVRGKRIK